MFTIRKGNWSCRPLQPSFYVRALTMWLTKNWRRYRHFNPLSRINSCRSFFGSRVPGGVISKYSTERHRSFKKHFHTIFWRKTWASPMVGFNYASFFEHFESSLFGRIFRSDFYHHVISWYRGCTHWTSNHWSTMKNLTLTNHTNPLKMPSTFLT